MNSPAIMADAAGTWQLGDLTVRRLGFGAMRLTGSGTFGNGAPSDREQSIAVLCRAVGLGVNHVDTAAFYFSALRSANELINTALAPYPYDLVIVTKVGPGRDAWGEWYSRRQEATPAQVRLAWTLHQGPNVLAIPGTGNPQHLAENVAAGALCLTEQDLALLGS